MKVLQLFNRYLSVGGEELWVDHLENEAGFTSFKVSSGDWTGKDAPSKLQQVRLMFSNPGVIRQLEDVISKDKPDVLLAHNLYPVITPAVYPFFKKKGIPLVQYTHNFRPFSVGGSLWCRSGISECSLKGNYLKEVLSGSWQGSVVKSLVMAAVLKNLHYRKWLDDVTGWIAISDFMRDKFIQAGIEPHKIKTLRHSWVAREEVKSCKESDYYLFLSRLTPEKGVWELLEAWRLLESQLGAECPRLLIGGNGSEAGLVAARAEQSEKIEFLGFLQGEEKERLISECRAMLAPSVWWEPLGLVAYEAYDFTRPMIASATGGLKETVQNGTTGYLHESGSVESLCEAVDKMEKQGVTGRRNMGAAGRKWLLREADPSKWREEFSAAIKSFI